MCFTTYKNIVVELNKLVRFVETSKAMKKRDVCNYPPQDFMDRFGLTDDDLTVLDLKPQPYEELNEKDNKMYNDFLKKYEEAQKNTLSYKIKEFQKAWRGLCKSINDYLITLINAK